MNSNMNSIELYNADCIDVLPSIQDHSVQMILTDPPYDSSSSQQVVWLNEMLRVCSGAVIVFCSPENQWSAKPDQYLFWIKPISTKNTSKRYSRFVEIMQVYGSGTWNPNRHWSQYTNVFTDLVDDVTHTYSKPLSLLTRLIRNHTNVGDIVLDPFMGSAPVGVVCTNINRRFIGIEQDADTFSQSCAILGVDNA